MTPIDELLAVNRLAIAAHEGFRAWLRERHAGHPKLPEYDIPFEECSEWEQLAYRAAAAAVRDAVLADRHRGCPVTSLSPQACGVSRADIDRYCGILREAFDRGALTPQQQATIRRNLDIVDARQQALTQPQPAFVIPDADMLHLHELARARWQPKRRAGVRDRLVDGAGLPGLLADVAGLMGEWAVSKYLAVPINQLAGLRGDGGAHDLVWRGYSVQVKTKKDADGRTSLIFPPHETFAADMAVLAVRTGEATLQLVGWCWRADFEERAVLVDLARGVGEQRVLDVADLRPMNSLWSVEPARRSA